MLKIRSYLPGKTSAVRHASTLFSYLSVMVVSRTKGYPAFTPVPLQIPQKSAIFFQSFFPWIESYSFVQRICFRDLEFLLQYKFEDGIVKFSQCSKRFFEILSFIIYIFNTTKIGDFFPILFPGSNRIPSCRGFVFEI